MKKKRLRYLPLLVVCVLVCLAISGFMVYRHSLNSRRDSDAQLEKYYTHIAEVFEQRAETLNNRNHSHEILDQTRLVTVAEAFTREGVTLDSGLQGTAAALMERLVDPSYLCSALLTDEAGNIMESVSSQYFRVFEPEENLLTAMGITEEQWQQLLKGTGDEDYYDESTPVALYGSHFYATDSISGLVEGETSEEESANVEKLESIFNDSAYSEIDIFSEPILTEDGDPTGLTLLYLEYPVFAQGSNMGLLTVDFVNYLDKDVTFLCVGDYSGSIDNENSFGASNFSELGLPEEVLTDGYEGNVSIAGKEYVANVRKIPFEIRMSNYYVIALRSQASFLRVEHVVWNAFIFLAFSFAFLIYGVSVREFSVGMALPASGRKKCFFLSPYFMKKLAPVGTICLVLVLIFSFIATTCCLTGEAMEDISTRQKGMADELASSYQYQVSSEEIKQYTIEEQMGILITYLQSKPEWLLAEDSAVGSVPYFVMKNGNTTQATDQYGNPISCLTSCENLSMVAYSLLFQQVSIYNADGYAIATTEEDHPLQISQEDPMMDVILWNTNYADQSTPETNGMAAAMHFMVYSDQDEEGITGYISQQEYEKRREAGSTTVREAPLTLMVNISELYISTTSTDDVLSYLLDEDTISGLRYVLLKNDDEHTIMYVPSFLKHETVEGLNLPQELLQGSSYYIARINGVKYLLYSNKLIFSNSDTSFWLISFANTETIYAQRAKNVLIFGLNTLFVLLGLFVILCLKPKNAATANTAELTPESEAINFLYSFTSKSGKKWKEKTAEQRLVTLWGIYANLLALWVLAVLLFATENHPLINYLKNMNWIRGLNLFSFVAAGIFTVLLHFFESIIQKLFTLLRNPSFSRTETFIRLASSILKYVMLIALIFYGLYLFGLNTVSVLTSLGAFSLIISLSANKLFGDIIAGVFIIIEGEFQVGDIVTIGNFCGKVTDIGVRTTKLENLDGNVNILTNSSIVSVLNMSNHLSRVKIDLGVKKDIPIEQVEACLKASLPEISGNCKIKHSMINYMGVDQISGSNNLYRVEAGCSEYLRNALTRYLNVELTRVFKENGIPLS